jgi:hypothetical protein
VLYLDSEGIGFTGPSLLWQYAVDDGPIRMHDVFLKPVSETLELLEWFTTQEPCAWHMAFDWFHVVQQFNVMKQISNKSVPPFPMEYYNIERKNPCTHFLRPKAALDLMIWCCEGKYQKLMSRKPIRVNRVPRILAYELVRTLGDRLKFDDVLFAGYKKKAPGWQIVELAVPDPDFVNISLKFRPSRSLDAVSKDVLGVGKAESYFHLLPDLREDNHRPYGGNWIDYADHYIDFWAEDPRARHYAVRDVKVLRDLHKALGAPAAGGYNSELTIVVANARWKGFEINHDKVEKIISDGARLLKEAPVNVNSPVQVRRYLKGGLPQLEASMLTSTSKGVLKKLAKREDEAGRRARVILKSRTAGSRARLFIKLRNCKRFHASLMVLGTLSDRMAGTDGINPQGINSDLRDAFTMAKAGEQTQGGDFDSFEIGIAQAIYKDEAMKKDLQSGKKLHALMAAQVFEEDYDTILLTDKGVCGVCSGQGQVPLNDEETVSLVNKYSKGEHSVEDTEIICPYCDGDGVVKDLYTTGKNVFFASMYGAEAKKLSFITGNTVEQMQLGLDNYRKRYPGVGREQMQMAQDYEALYQVGSGPIQWRQPKLHVESLLGFKRHFDLEYEVIRELHNLAIGVPKAWRTLPTKVMRRMNKGPQFPAQAVSSALFGAAFGQQAQVKRQAGNHKVQSTGAGICKRLELKLWHTYQPIGVHEPVAQLLNIHDEVLGVTPSNIDFTDTVNDFVEEYKELVPLIGMTWNTKLSYWGHKPKT